MTDSQHIVTVGDIYADLDPRQPDRRIKVLAIEGEKAVVQHVSGHGVRSKVRLDRLRPLGKLKGYKLVERKVVEAPKSEGDPQEIPAE